MTNQTILYEVKCRELHISIILKHGEAWILHNINKNTEKSSVRHENSNPTLLLFYTITEFKIVLEDRWIHST